MSSNGTPEAWRERAHRQITRVTRSVFTEIDNGVTIVTRETKVEVPCKIIKKGGFFDKEIDWCETHRVEDSTGHDFGRREEKASGSNT